MWHPTAHQFQMLQIFGLGFFKCVHIDLEFRVAFCSELCHAQLIAHVAGKVLIRSLPAGFRIVSISGRIFENHTRQFSGDALIVTGSAQQVGHVGQIDLAMLTNGHRQCFAGGSTLVTTRSGRIVRLVNISALLFNCLFSSKFSSEQSR